MKILISDLKEFRLFISNKNRKQTFFYPLGWFFRFFIDRIEAMILFPIKFILEIVLKTD